VFGRAKSKSKSNTTKIPPPGGVWGQSDSVLNSYMGMRIDAEHRIDELIFEIE